MASADAVERHGAEVGRCAAGVSLEARRRLIERDKLLAGEKAEIDGGDPRPRAETV